MWYIKIVKWCKKIKEVCMSTLIWKLQNYESNRNLTKSTCSINLSFSLVVVDFDILHNEFNKFEVIFNANKCSDTNSYLKLNTFKPNLNLVHCWGYWIKINLKYS